MNPWLSLAVVSIAYLGGVLHAAMIATKVPLGWRIAIMWPILYGDVLLACQVG